MSFFQGSEIIVGSRHRVQQRSEEEEEEEEEEGKERGEDGKIMTLAGRNILRFIVVETKSTVNFYGDPI